MSIFLAKQHRRGFTLVELLIVILIITVLTAMSMAALAGAAQEGKRQRARTQITKIDTLIMEKWNSYRYRQVPIRIPARTEPRTAAQMRLYAIRELIRLELPDRMTDVLFWDTANNRDATVAILPNRPALSQRYLALTKARLAVSGATFSNLVNEQAECLYLILSQMRDGDRSAINFFLESEIGDTDEDGMKEILDPWGSPIVFLRWAPGYSKGIPDWTAAPYSQPAVTSPSYAPLTAQNTNYSLNPDPFDPLKADRRFDTQDVVIQGTLHMNPFALKPLILSAGPDKSTDIVKGYYDGSFCYTNTKVGSSPIPNDPYYIHGAGTSYFPWIGACVDTDTDESPNKGDLNYFDNITNHDIVFEGQ